jgi:hypothetical protein
MQRKDCELGQNALWIETGTKDMTRHTPVFDYRRGDTNLS